MFLKKEIFYADLLRFSRTNLKPSRSSSSRQTSAKMMLSHLKGCSIEQERSIRFCPKARPSATTFYKSGQLRTQICTGH